MRVDRPEVQDVITLTKNSSVITISPASVTGSYTLVLPANDGNANQVLATDGNGILSWSSVVGGSATPAGANLEVQFNDGGSFGTSSVFTWNKDTSILSVGHTGVVESHALRADATDGGHLQNSAGKEIMNFGPGGTANSTFYGPVNFSSTIGVTSTLTGSGAVFSGGVQVLDEAYGAGWDGNVEVPTKNAIYDKIQTLGGGGANPAGGGTELQYRLNASTFGAVTNSSVINGAVTLSEKVNINIESSVNSTSTVALVLSAQSSSNVSANFGTQVNFLLESSTTADQEAGALAFKWSTATHATRVSDAIIKTYDGLTGFFETFKIRPINAFGDGAQITSGPTGSALFRIYAAEFGGTVTQYAANYWSTGANSTTAFWNNATFSGNPHVQFNSSKVLLGSAAADTVIGAKVQIIANDASIFALRVDSAASPVTDIAQFTDNGTARFRINTSVLTFKPSTDGVALQIQKANGASVFTVDTSTPQIVMNGYTTIRVDNGWLNFANTAGGPGQIQHIGGCVIFREASSTQHFAVGTSGTVYVGTNTTQGSTGTAAQSGNGKVSGISGSGDDVIGRNISISGGRSTGSALGGIVTLQANIPGASSSVLNTVVDKYLTGIYKNITANSSALSLFEVSLPTLKGCAGFVNYQIFATDNTDVQVRSGVLTYSAVNKGGSYTSASYVVSENVAVSAGTLTGNWSITTDTNKIILNMTPETSLSTSTYYVTYSIDNPTAQPITIL